MDRESHGRADGERPLPADSVVDEEAVPDLELDDSSSEQVSGGAEPPPGGPVPLPYPNTFKG